MRSSFDAVIVGGGIVGAACARELALAGLQVAICEQSDHIGGGATAAGMGHLAVIDDSEAQFALTHFSQRLWRELAPELPQNAEYLGCGSLWIAADGEELAEARHKFCFFAERGVAVDLLDHHQLKEAEPNLRPGLAGALLLAQDSVCYSPCAAACFADQIKFRGGEILLRTAVTRVSDDGVQLQDGSLLSAGLVIVATGVALSQLVPGVQVRARKGHLVITDRYPGFLRHQLIELGYLKSAHASDGDSVAFNAQPRSTGQILIGSSRQYGSDESCVEPAMLRSMLRRALEYMPGLEHLSVLRAWTGFRAATPDKLPLIGLCPGFTRVYAAGGHEGLGISMALGTARLLADQILDRASDISRAPYEPARSLVCV